MSVKLYQMTGKINAVRNVSKTIISKKITLLSTCFGLKENLTANIFLYLIVKVFTSNHEALKFYAEFVNGVRI